MKYRLSIDDLDVYGDVVGVAICERLEEIARLLQIADIDRRAVARADADDRKATEGMAKVEVTP